MKIENENRLHISVSFGFSDFYSSSNMILEIFIFIFCEDKLKVPIGSVQNLDIVFQVRGSET